MKLTNGENTYTLNDPIMIDAFLGSGYHEVAEEAAEETSAAEGKRGKRS